MMAKGDKMMKSSWFHKPDYDGASQQYNQAANVFRAGMQWKECVDAYEKASDAYDKNGIGFSAAEMLEKAAMIINDKLKDPARAGQFFARASRIYTINGNAAKACDVLKKGARVLENVDPVQALNLLHTAVDIFREAERMIYTTDLYKMAISISLRQHILADALEVLRQWRDVALTIERRSDTYKTGLALVIVNLARGDAVAASRDFERTTIIDTAFVQDDNGRAASQLIDAFESESQEALDGVKKLQTFDFLEPEVLKIARKLSIENPIQDQSEGKQSEFGKDGDERMKNAGDDQIVGAVEAMTIADATMSESTAANKKLQRLKEERERMLLFSKSSKGPAKKPQPKPEADVDSTESATSTTTTTPEKPEPKPEAVPEKKEEEPAAAAKPESEPESKPEPEPEPKPEPKPEPAKETEDAADDEEEDPYGLL